MLTIKTSQFGNDYGDKTLLYPQIEVQRTPKTGLIMRDKNAEQRITRYHTDGRVGFPAIYSRRIHDVMLCDSHILYDDETIYTDNLITALFAHDAAALEHTARGHAAIAADKEQTVSRVEHIREPVIVTANEGSGTWGHWVIHNFPKIALARETFPDHKILVPVPYFSGGYANFGDLLWMLGLKSDEMIGIYPDCRYKLDEAVLVDFLYTHSVHPATLDLFDRIGASCDDTSDFAEKVQIERTTSGKREITNKDMLDTHLAEAGFQKTVQGALPLRKQIAVWRSGRQFCSVLGSDLTNIVFGRPGSSILAITPSVFHDNFFFDLAEARGMIWNELFCGEISVERSGPSSDFIVDELALRRFMRIYRRPD
ncbi:glycosyltransferase family 61 protein [Rhizosaccharibacter radicis]|uniref:Glycosyltransferase family 61 protein n=1 Tax=Rhizosaccharibacter radicis TaxID=2782605 RepID=A0ABT1VUB6_9PROT|nr:glycosyltransferase family 61 protein [Acetobacteraceae bacterium KSS12]